MKETIKSCREYPKEEQFNVETQDRGPNNETTF